MANEGSFQQMVSLVPRLSITANSVEGLVKLLSSSSTLAVIEGLGMRLQKAWE